MDSQSEEFQSGYFVSKVSPLLFEWMHVYCLSLLGTQTLFGNWKVVAPSSKIDAPFCRLGGQLSHCLQDHRALCSVLEADPTGWSPAATSWIHQSPGTHRKLTILASLLIF
jgi:hypothetical protein